jgi:sugar phosphate permease
VPATQLLALYQRWKWRILVVYASFYLFQYVGRFHLSQVAALVMQDLAIDHHTLGWITALLYWGFMAGDLVHGRLGEIYGLRLWVLLGALLTTACNWLASLSISAVTLAILWCLNGFVNAACWSPGISLLAQWWPRRERGQALGIVGMAASLLSPESSIMFWCGIVPATLDCQSMSKMTTCRVQPKPLELIICMALAHINVCSRTRSSCSRAR